MPGQRVADLDHAAIIAAYRACRSENETARAFGASRYAVHVILGKAGVEPNPIGRRLDVAGRAAMRAAIEPLWRAGETLRGIRRAIGKGVSNDTIRALMADVPRGAMSPRDIPLVVPLVLSDDEAAWRWFAGVFDARGIVSRDTRTGLPSIAIGCGRDPEFAAAIRVAIGLGKANENSKGFCRWRVGRIADVRVALERALPFLRFKHVIVRRIVAEIAAREAGP